MTPADGSGNRQNPYRGQIVQPDAISQQAEPVLESAVASVTRENELLIDGTKILSEPGESCIAHVRTLEGQVAEALAARGLWPLQISDTPGHAGMVVVVRT